MFKSIKVSKNKYYHWFKNKAILSCKTLRGFLKERDKLIFEQNQEVCGSSGIQK